MNHSEQNTGFDGIYPWDSIDIRGDAYGDFNKHKWMPFIPREEEGRDDLDDEDWIDEEMNNYYANDQFYLYPVPNLFSGSIRKHPLGRWREEGDNRIEKEIKKLRMKTITLARREKEVLRDIV